MNDSSYRYEKAIRRSPRIWQPGYIIHKIIHEELVYFSRFINTKNDGAVLDFGCGKSPFRNLFKSYVGADVDKSAKEPDYLIDISTNRIRGIADNSISNIISVEVVEHIPSIEAYITEAKRVLKPGGFFLIIAPFMYNFHGNDDYARYSKNFFISGEMFKDFEITQLNFTPNDFITFIIYQINHFFEIFIQVLNGMKSLVDDCGF